MQLANNAKELKLQIPICVRLKWFGQPKTEEFSTDKGLFATQLLFMKPLFYFGKDTKAAFSIL